MQGFRLAADISRSPIVDGTDRGGRRACHVREDALKYFSCLGLRVFALALVLYGCAGLPSRAVSDNTEPPAWNLPEIMMMNTEIASAAPAGGKPAGSERALASVIAATRSSL